jgi:hypothetical protein
MIDFIYRCCLIVQRLTTTSNPFFKASINFDRFASKSGRGCCFRHRFDGAFSVSQPTRIFKTGSRRRKHVYVSLSITSILILHNHSTISHRRLTTGTALFAGSTEHPVFSEQPDSPGGAEDGQREHAEGAGQDAGGHWRGSVRHCSGPAVPVPGNLYVRVPSIYHSRRCACDTRAFV